MTAVTTARTRPARFLRWGLAVLIALNLLPCLLVLLYLVARVGAFGPDGAGAAARRHRRRGRAVLPPSRRRFACFTRSGRGGGRHRGGTRRLDHHPADGEEPVPVVGTQLRAQGA